MGKHLMAKNPIDYAVPRRDSKRSSLEPWVKLNLIIVALIGVAVLVFFGGCVLIYLRMGPVGP